MYSAQQQARTNQYFENSITTASPAQLLIMLCDGAIRHCRQGMEAMERKDISATHHHLCKAQDIINEFIVTLDPEAEISASLLSLYEYFLTKLREANIHKIPEPVAEVVEFLRELRETWVEAAKQAKQAKPAQAGTASQYE